MMLVDSSVWIDFLSGRDDFDLARRLLNDEVALCGQVLSEVLSGVRKPRQRDQLEARFSALTYLEQTKEVHLRAARLYSDLRRQGVTVPLSNCVIAAVALENGVPLLTTDRHFDAFPNLTQTE